MGLQRASAAATGGCGGKIRQKAVAATPRMWYFLPARGTIPPTTATRAAKQKRIQIHRKKGIKEYAYHYQQRTFRITKKSCCQHDHRGLAERAACNLSI